MKYFIYILIFTLTWTNASAQWDTKDPIQFQKELDEWYANKETSALPKDAFDTFDGLKFFPINEDFIIEATFIKSQKRRTNRYGTSAGLLEK